MVILKEVEVGAKVSKTCRKYGLSNATYYKLKSAQTDPERQPQCRLDQTRQIYSRTDSVAVAGAEVENADDTTARHMGFSDGKAAEEESSA